MKLMFTPWLLIALMGVPLWAQQPGAPDPTGQMISTVVMFALIIAVFYFFIIRPQQKRQREMRQMLDQLKRGDRVVTSAGIHGTVAEIDDKTVLLQVADNVRMRFEKVAIATVEKKQSND
jgi:preprotein translocase subunit YajC